MVQHGGAAGSALFLFCLVEGFTHTHSRKKYFAKVYILSAAMSALLFLMAFGGILVRPDGFYPGNGMMTTFAVLMVIWQGIDWLGQKKDPARPGGGDPPLAWPILASQLSVAFPALATPLGFAAYSVLPAWGTTGDSSWPVLVMGLVLYLFRKRRGCAGGGLLRLLHPLWRSLYGRHSLRYGPGLRLVAALHPVL